MAEVRDIRVHIDLGVKRLLLIPVLVGLLLLAVALYGYTSIAGNERLSLVTQGFAIAGEMESLEQDNWDQSQTGEWVMRFIDMANSQGDRVSEVAADADPVTVTKYAQAIDRVLASQIRRGVRERVVFEVQTNYLRAPKAVDPYKLLEAAWKGMLLQHTVLPAVTPTPTSTPTPVPSGTLKVTACGMHHNGEDFTVLVGEARDLYLEGNREVVIGKARCVEFDGMPWPDFEWFDSPRNRFGTPVALPPMTPTPTSEAATAAAPPLSLAPAFQPEEKSESFWLWEPEWWAERMPEGSFLAVCVVVLAGVIVIVGAIVAYFENWI